MGFSVVRTDPCADQSRWKILQAAKAPAHGVSEYEGTGAYAEYPGAGVENRQLLVRDTLICRRAA